MGIPLVEHEVLQSTAMNAVPIQGSYFIFGGGGRRASVEDRALRFHTSGEVACSHHILQILMERGEFGVRAVIMDETEEGSPYFLEEGFLANVLEIARWGYRVHGCEGEGVSVEPPKRRDQVMIEGVAKDGGVRVAIEGYQRAIAFAIRKN